MANKDAYSQILAVVSFGFAFTDAVCNARHASGALAEAGALLGVLPEAAELLGVDFGSIGKAYQSLSPADLAKLQTELAAKYKAPAGSIEAKVEKCFWRAITILTTADQLVSDWNAA